MRNVKDTVCLGMIALSVRLLSPKAKKQLADAVVRGLEKNR